MATWAADCERSIPYQHLISSSFTGGSQRPDLFALPEMDFAQYHSYNEKHPARMMAERTASFFEKYDKPFFVSEYGTDWKGWKPDTDPHFRALHQAIWSGAFTGAAGTGMTWWWENIHTGQALPPLVRPGGLSGRDRDRTSGPATGALGRRGGPVIRFGVAARDEALVWLLDRAYDWPDGAMEARPDARDGCQRHAPGVEDGAWSVEWWDTLAGKRVASGEVTAAGGTLRLEVPTFQIDVAARSRNADFIRDDCIRSRQRDSIVIKQRDTAH